MNPESQVENQGDKKPEVFQRLDKRKLDEYRLLKLTFGREWGNCVVTLGDTQILAQVFVNIVCPNYFHPHEGQFQINLTLAGQPKTSKETIKTKEILDGFYKNSNFIDLKALCLITGKEVWKLEVDLNVLTMDGNVIGCSSIAILAALMHFRRRDVDSIEDNVTVGNATEKILMIYHHPVITSYAIFENGDVLDPSMIEESECEGKMFVCFDNLGELCGVISDECLDLSFVHHMNCLNNAATITFIILDHIKSAIENDIKDRSSASAQSLESTVIEDFSLKLCLSDRFKSNKSLRENKNEKNIEVDGANNAVPKTDLSNQSTNTRDQKLIINHVNDTHSSTSSDKINTEETERSNVSMTDHRLIINTDPCEIASSRETYEIEIREFPYEIDNDGVIIID